jgi:hypothetical protein
MSKITFTADAPVKDSVRFTFGNSEFTLDPGKEYETDDAVTLQSASVHPWLDVTFTAPEDAPVVELDQSDPHVNPTVDHLSAQADPAVKEAAAEADAAQQAVNQSGVEGHETVEQAPDAPAPTPAPVPAAAPTKAPTPDSQVTN